MAEHSRKESLASEFTPEELLRLQRTLRRRYLPLSKNIVDVGFGYALCDVGSGGAKKRAKKTASSRSQPAGPDRQRLDATRPFCVKFFVKRKWKSRPEQREDLIPRQVDFTLTRAGKPERFTLPTDVVEFHPPRLTGAKVKIPGDAATAGYVVRWRESGSGATVFWAVTVGHLFSGVPVGTIVDVTVSAVTFQGTLLGTAPGGSFVDGALVEADEGDLRTAGIISGSTSTADTLSLTDLAAVNGQPGKTLRVPSERNLEFRTLFPDTSQFPTLGNLRFVVEAWSDSSQCFQKGTSGAAWSYLGEGAAVQVGGTKKKHYQQGFAQAAETVLNWVKSFLGSKRNMVSNSFAVAEVF